MYARTYEHHGSTFEIVRGGIGERRAHELGRDAAAFERAPARRCGGSASRHRRGDSWRRTAARPPSPRSARRPRCARRRWATLRRSRPQCTGWNAYESSESAPASKPSTIALDPRIVTGRAPATCSGRKCSSDGCARAASGASLAIGDRAPPCRARRAGPAASRRTPARNAAARRAARSPSSRADCASRGPSRRSARLRRRSGASARPSAT